MLPQAAPVPSGYPQVSGQPGRSLQQIMQARTTPSKQSNATTPAKRSADDDEDENALKRRKLDDLDDEESLLGAVQHTDSACDSTEPVEEEPSGDPPGDDDGGKKKRTGKPQRVLDELLERGLGPTCSGVSTGYGVRPHGILGLPWEDAVCPWHRRVYVNRTNPPYGETDILRLIEDEKTMKRMAEYWSAPSYEDGMLRTLPTDTEDVNVQDSMLMRSKALMAMANTTIQDNVFAYTKTDEVGAGILPQFHGDRHSAKHLHEGPCGGAESNTIVLWELTLDPPNAGEPSEQMLQLASVLSMGLSTPDVQYLVPGISSDYTEIVPRNKICNNMRMKHGNCKRALHRLHPHPLSKDIDPVLLEKILHYRRAEGAVPADAGGDHPGVIPKRCRSNDPDRVSDELSEREKQFFSTMVEGSLFSLDWFIAVYPCVNADNKVSHIQMAALRLTGKPYVCPILALSQLKNEGSHQGTDLSQRLLPIIAHMCDVLEIEQQACTIKSLFNLESENNAAHIMGEEMMFRAVFEFAHKHNLYNLHVGGRRMDVTNRAEMALYDRFCAGIQNARQGHCRMVSESVFHHLSMQGNLSYIQDSSNAIHRDAMTQKQTYGEYAGFVFLSLSRAELNQRIEERVQANGMQALEHNSSMYCLSCAIPTSEDLQNKMSAWFTSERNAVEHEIGLGQGDQVPGIYLTDDMAYAPVNFGGFWYNHGWLAPIHLDLRPAYTKRNTSREKNKASNVDENFIIKPTEQSMLAQLYFDIDLRLGVFWSEDELIPDLDYIKEKEFKVPPQLHRILQAVRETREDMDLRHEKKDKLALKQRNIMYLAGVTPHPIRKLLQESSVCGDLHTVGFRQHVTLIGMIRKTLIRQIEGPLVQFSMSAQVVQELRNPEPPSSSNFLDFHANYNEFTRHLARRSAMHSSPYKDVGMMQFEEMSEQMNQWFLSRQNFDLSFCNSMTVNLMHNSLIMMFYGLDGPVCGNINMLYDGAGTFNVALIGKNGSVTVIAYMRKTPGCGADYCAATAAMINLGFAAFMLRSPRLQAFWNNPENWDVLLNHVTAFRIMCLLGSAVMSDSMGMFDPTDLTPLRELGRAGASMELGKQNEGTDTGQRDMKLFEIRTDQPTQGMGLTPNPWDTSVGLKKQAPFVLSRVLPIFVVTSNVCQQGIAESTLNGCRCIAIPSSSPDHCGIILFCVNGSQMPDVMPAALPTEETENMDAGEDDVGLGLRFLKTDDMSTLKSINLRMVKNDLIGYWIHFMLRKCVAFLGKTMKLHYKARTGSFHGNLWGMELAVRGITHHLWRRFVTDDKVFYRNFMAAVKSVFLPAEHLRALAWQSVMCACERPTLDSDGKTPMVNMGQAFDSMIMSVLYVPPSMLTFLSSLYLWLSMAILDIQLVVVTCFCLYSMNIQLNCPLLVLALEANGYPLTEDQERRFDYIANVFIEACCVRKKECPSGLLTKGHMSSLGEEDNTMLLLEKLFGPNKDDHAREMSKLKENREKMKELSPYIYPRLGLVTKEFPSWGKYSQASMNMNRQNNVNAHLSTHKDIVAQLFADQMTAERAKERSHPNEKAHQNTELFWLAASAGFRLPRKPTNKTDKFTLNFESIWLTAMWYNEVMDNATQVCGVTDTFLKLCGLSTSNSMHEIFTKIFKRKLNNHAFPKIGKWSMPASATSQKFVWGAALTNEKGGRCGLETMLGANALWLLVAQGLYASEWNKPHVNELQAKGKCQVVLHTRITSQAVLHMLSLLIHALVEKACVPANAGQIRLRGSNPYMSQYGRETAMITFDERLHLDNHTILSKMSRNAKNMTICTLIDNTQCMVYDHEIHSQDNAWAPRWIHEIAPFPPESSAHCLSHSYRHYNALMQYMQKDLPLYGPECYYALAVHDFLKSMHIEDEPRGVEKMTSYMQVTPTYCMTQPGVEMPFVSTRYNYLCVVETYQDGTFGIRSTHPTNQFLEAEYQALPLDHEEVFPYKEFHFATVGGLLQHTDGSVTCRRPADLLDPAKQSTNAEVLGLTPFPVTLWPHILKFSITGQQLCMREQNNDDVFAVALVDCRTQFQADCEQHIVVDTEEFLHFNPDIGFRDVPGQSLHVIHRPTLTSPFGRKWRFLLSHEDLVADCLELTHELLQCYLGNIDIQGGHVHTIHDKSWEQLNVDEESALTRVLRPYHFVRVKDEEGNDCFWVPLHVNQSSWSFWLVPESEESKDYTYFSSREHLKYAMRHNEQESPKPEFAGFMLQPYHMLPSHDSQRYHFMPISGTEEPNACVSRQYTYAEKRADDLNTCMLQNYNRFLRESSLARCQRRLELGNVADPEKLNKDMETLHAQIQTFQGYINEATDRLLRSEPTRTLLRTLTADCEQDLQYTIGPIQPSEDAGAYMLGILQKHDCGQFLQHGHYKVGFYLQGEEHSTSIDFITASYCTMTEGRRVYLEMNQTRYRDLLNCVPGAYLNNAKLHRDVLNGDAIFYLTAFYIVSPDEFAEVGKMCMQVLIQVHDKRCPDDDYYSFNNDVEQKVMLSVKVFDHDGACMIDTGRPNTNALGNECILKVLTDEEEQECQIANFLVRHPYLGLKCPHGDFKHQPPSRSNAVYLKK